MPLHQIAFLNAERLVPWKCLSLDVLPHGSRRDLVPVAYASASPAFMSGVPTGTRLSARRSGGQPVLWIVSRPKYRVHGFAPDSFPYSLTAKIVVDKVVGGDVIREWAKPHDRGLVTPSGESRRLKDWQQARFIVDPRCRTIFRIARVFATSTLRASQKRAKKSKGKKEALTERQAWAQVRTAIADQSRSRFLAHISATYCVKRAARNLLCPRTLKTDGVIAELETLAQTASCRTVFLNYRFCENPELAVRVAKAVLRSGRGVWLDGLTIPHFTDKRHRRDSPGNLGALLRHGIVKAHLFLTFAGEEFDSCSEDGRSPNWALKEFRYARSRAKRTRRPKMRVVALERDRSALPSEVVDASHGRLWSPSVQSVADGVGRLLPVKGARQR